MAQRQRSAHTGAPATPRLALAGAPVPHEAIDEQHVDWAFPPRPETPGLMRARLRPVLARWEICGELAEDALLVATELVANAVDHAGTALRFRARIGGIDSGGALRLAVHDRRADLPPRPTDAGPHALRGRGLRVIDVLSRRWGCDPAPDGKTVWAELALP